MKTFNKKGDHGETSLLYGARVSKADLRCEAYGTIDEAVSALGLARTLSTKQKAQDTLLMVQKELFILGAELATPHDHYTEFSKKYPTINNDRVSNLEKLIDEFEQELEMPREFIIPGDNTSSAAIDVARTIIRRAERRVAELKSEGILQNEHIQEYLNRLADLVFTMARYEAT